MFEDPAVERLRRDVDDLVVKSETAAGARVAVVVSYDSTSMSGSARASDGAVITFKNWLGGPLIVNTKVFILTKDAVNYVVATEETVSGWASTQSVVRLPVATTAYQFRADDVGKMIITTATAGTVTMTVGTGLSLAVGQSIDILRGANAEVQFANGGATLHGTPGFRLRDAWSAATLLCVGANQYVVVGDLKV